MDKKKGKGDIPNVVPEATLDDVPVSHDYRMTRGYLGYRRADTVVADQVEHDVNFGEVGMPGYVEIARLHLDTSFVALSQKKWFSNVRFTTSCSTPKV